jgi:hypothetical protein
MITLEKNKNLRGNGITRQRMSTTMTLGNEMTKTEFKQPDRTRTALGYRIDPPIRLDRMSAAAQQEFWRSPPILTMMKRHVSR